MRKTTKKEIVIAIPFWGGMILLGLKYGWILPTALFFILISVIAQIVINYKLNK